MLGKYAIDKKIHQTNQSLWLLWVFQMIKSIALQYFRIFIYIKRSYFDFFLLFTVTVLVSSLQISFTRWCVFTLFFLCKCIYVFLNIISLSLCMCKFDDAKHVFPFFSFPFCFENFLIFFPLVVVVTISLYKPDQENRRMIKKKNRSKILVMYL